MRTPNILAIVGAMALGAAMAGSASASALHGICNGTSAGACVDNGTNTPLDGSTEFGFTYSGSSAETGTFSLDILLPNNYTDPSSFSVTEANSTVVTADRVSTTAWTTGALDAYLGINASPNNPIGAYLPVTQVLDSSATGFFVYQVMLSDFTLPKNGGTAAYQFDAVSGLGVGSYILGFLSNSADCGSGAKKSAECATANSGALLVNGTTTSVPEPGSLALFAGALAALGLFVGLRRRAPKA